MMAKKNTRAAARQAGTSAGDSADRLKDLRAELARRGVDGYIVPRADEHQGEYVAARSERLAWLTGFTGSAGLAVILKRKAAVFTDGRYTIQVRDQVEQDLYQCHHITEAPATAWIAKHLPKGGKLAYDPWLLTPNQVARFRGACEKAGGQLVPLKDNAIDAVWDDQPEPPLATVRVHPRKFAGRSSADKRADIAKILKSLGQDGQILSAPDSIAWLLNIRGADVPRTPFALSFAVIHKTGTVDWCIDDRKLSSAVKRHLGAGVRLHAPDGLGAVLDKLGKKAAKVRLDATVSPMWIAQRLERAGTKISRAPDLCQLPKARKNHAEQDGMRAAHLRDGAAVCRFLAWLSAEAPGGEVTELDAAAYLHDMRKQTGLLRDLSFDTISGAGPNGAIVHYKATPKTNRRLRPGQLYLVDSGGQYLDGTTDITRTVAIVGAGTGKSKRGPSREMKDRFTRVLKGHIALALARFPKGTTGSQLDPLARRALWEVGLDYDHGTGHGVGSYLSVHEGPQRISKVASTVALEPGMVISNEPGYYKTGAYGIRIENLVLVTEAKLPRGGERDLLEFETLTLAPIDRCLVDTALLDKIELGWLNAYHARVWKTMKGLVDQPTRHWLKQATAPIKP